jgi:hypothetical protein
MKKLLNCVLVAVAATAFAGIAQAQACPDKNFLYYQAFHRVVNLICQRVTNKS